MLELHIRTEASHVEWRATPCGWSAGSSRIEPYPHVALESFAVASSRRLLFVVRERCTGVASPVELAPGSPLPLVDDDTWSHQAAAAAQWPLQFVNVVIDAHGAKAGVELAIGDWAHGAVFLTSNAGELIGSWDAARLYRHLREPRLDPVLASHFLASFDAPYSRRTMFAGMQVMTHRSTARWSGGEVEVEYPLSVDAEAPRDLKTGADVTGTFRKIVRSSIARWLPPGFRGAAAELSGGLDSAIVAATASEVLDVPLLTEGIILLGEMGEAQRARRLELVERFGFDDDTVELRDFLPLNAASVRFGTPVVPWEDCYYEGLHAMLERAVARDATVVFTGIGGDELCGPSVYDMSKHDAPPKEIEPEDPMPSFLTARAREMVRETERSLDHAPLALVCSSSLSAAQSSSALAMRLGLWTINPLCTPELVAFCNRLPSDWRHDRAIERRVLESLGCSRNIYHPPAPDDFSSACVRGVRSAGRAMIEPLFRRCRLADMGLVDRDRLLADYRRWCESDRSDGDLPFYAAAILERSLQAG